MAAQCEWRAAVKSEFVRLVHDYIPNFLKMKIKTLKKK